MDRIQAQEYDNIDKIFGTLVLEFGTDSRNVKTFILSANHDLGISHRISGEKIYDKRNEEDCRDRIMRYLSYCKHI